MKTIAIVLMLLLYPQKPDIRWFYVTSSKEKRFYYDLQTLSKYGNKKIQVWIRSEVKQNIKPVPKIHETKVLYEIDCVNGMLRTTRGVSYNKSGKVLDSQDMPNSNWENPVPDSVSETIVETICKVAEKLP